MNDRRISLDRDSRSITNFDTSADSLIERLCADLVQRWHRGERVPVEAYLRQHPELENDERSFELILTEVLLRQEFGERAPLEEFLWRFPGSEQRLRRHFALHAGLVAAKYSIEPTVTSTPIAITVSTDLLPNLPDYEIVEFIGRGGMGIVYKAREASLGRYVAVKLLRDDHVRAPDQLARFLREARTASGLNHPGICTVHALREHDGRPYIVMELIEGVTLRVLVSRRPQPDEVARIISQAALALAAAHAAGVVHRDIKPENIMARADGQVKVVDFGLARLLPAGSVASLRQAIPPRVPTGSDSGTDRGALAGTLSYMSPEQTRSEAAGSASDVFSLGIVAYELITGRHPFASGSALETFNAIATRPAIPPRQFEPTLSPELEALLLQMLDKDSRLRPTAAEIASVLDGESRTKTRLSEGAGVKRPPRKTVGRDVERQALWTAFEAVDQANALLLCVSGEPGIGKTTLVEDWLRELSGRVSGIGRGRCSERLSGTGSYLPVLEALEGLLHGEVGSLATRTMCEFAPAWYAQVVPDRANVTAGREASHVETATQERMKREFFAFVTEFGRRQPLVFFFDDLHWADASTVDLLAWLGRRSAGLRLLVVTTHRPAELHSGKHAFVPVQLELQRHGVCREVPLEFLTQSDVECYLELWFPIHQFPTDLANRLHAQTEGNPLFLSALMHHLQDRGLVTCREGCWTLAQAIPDFQKELPVSVRSLIRRQFDQLDSADYRLLSVGSVQGYEFDAVVAAGILARGAADIEERLDLLDRVHGLVRLVREQELPDGTLTLRYRFVHVLYQNSLYAAIPLSRRAEWGKGVAESLLAHHGSRNAVVVSEAALLFEKARAWAQAAECFYLAARNPLRRQAHRESAVLARCGLKVLARLPDSPDRARQEARLQLALGLALQQSEGFAAPEVVEAYRRGRELSHVEMEIDSRSPLLWGLWSFYILRGEHRAACQIADSLSELAQGQTDALVSLAANHSMGYSQMMLGQPMAAWSHLGKNLPAETQAVYGRDLGIPYRAHGSVVLWLLGFPDQAVVRSHQAAALAREKLDLYGLSIALFNAAKVHQLRGEVEATAEYAQTLLALADEQAFPVWFAAGTILAGWAQARQGQWEVGAARIRQGIDAFVENGAAMMHPHFLGLLAEALETGGQIDEALDVLDRALKLVDETDERYYEAELHRLRGELLLKTTWEIDRTDEVHGCFQLALAIARQQQSRSLELRAAISAARLNSFQAKRQNNPALVQPLLQPICSLFTEGFSTRDWRAAAALCEQSH